MKPRFLFVGNTTSSILAVYRMIRLGSGRIHKLDPVATESAPGTGIHFIRLSPDDRELFLNTAPATSTDPNLLLYNLTYGKTPKGDAVSLNRTCETTKSAYAKAAEFSPQKNEIFIWEKSGRLAKYIIRRRPDSYAIVNIGCETSDAW